MEWQSECGRVRLMCGDSFEYSGGAPVSGVVTDPPYGVDYAGGHFHCGDVNIVNERERLDGDDVGLWDRVFPFLRGVVQTGPVYVFFPILLSDRVLGVARDVGVDPRAVIIWHKSNATYPSIRAQYKQRFEPFLYGVVGKAFWQGKGDECTVWEGPRVSECVHHPTEKPVWIFKRMMLNHAVDHWFDPFMGGGSSAVAAAELIRQGKDIRFTGIDIKREYFETAVTRVKAVLSQRVLF